MPKPRGGDEISSLYITQHTVPYTYPTGKIHTQLPTNSLTQQTSHQIQLNKNT